MKLLDKEGVLNLKQSDQVSVGFSEKQTGYYSEKVWNVNKLELRTTSTGKITGSLYIEYSIELKINLAGLNLRGEVWGWVNGVFGYYTIHKIL